MSYADPASLGTPLHGTRRSETPDVIDGVAREARRLRPDHPDAGACFAPSAVERWSRQRLAVPAQYSPGGETRVPGGSQREP